MADKKTELSIVLRAVDKATARVKAINDKIDAANKPFRDFRKALGELRENAGLDGVIDGFKGVGGAIAGIVAKIGMIGGAVAAATAGVLSLVDHFDDLGDKAEAMGVSVDFLAQMRYAAERSGASVEDLDGGLKSFTKNLGLARANTGGLVKFLGKVSPALLKQLKATKSNEEGIALMAAAFAKVTDPAKKAALAQKVFGDASLAPLFGKGAKGIQELRDRYAQLAGSQEEAAAAAGGTDDALKDLKASTDGVKAALVRGLAPALTTIIAKLTTWLTGNRAQIAEWAQNIGEKLPGAVQRVVEWVSKAVDKVGAFVDRIGGLKTIAIAAGAIIAGPLISAVVSLGGALFTAGRAMAVLFSGTRIGQFIQQITGATKSVNELGDAAGKAGKKGRGGGGGRAGIIDRGFEFIADAAPKTPGEKRQAMEAMFGKEYVDSWGASIAEQLATFKGGIQTGSQQAKITIDIANAPSGTRVRTDPQSTADVDLSVGYQMQGAM